MSVSVAKRLMRCNEWSLRRVMALQGLPFVASKTLVMSKYWCESCAHATTHISDSLFFLSLIPIANLHTSASNLRWTKGKCHSCVTSRCATTSHHLSLSQSSILTKWYIAVRLFFTLLWAKPARVVVNHTRLDLLHWYIMTQVNSFSPTLNSCVAMSFKCLLNTI